MPYRWTGRCNRHLSDILNACGGIDRFEAVAQAYLADRWQGYDGHELKHLSRDLTKFLARAIASRTGGGGGAVKPRFQDN